VRQPLSIRLLGGLAILAGVLLAMGPTTVAAATSNYDFRYGSGVYKGAVGDCVTSATVGLDKAGFSDVHSESHPSNSSVYGVKDTFQAVVICTKAGSSVTYTELVFGPSGSTLTSLFNSLDNNFK
jgi:hypothetical protein